MVLLFQALIAALWCTVATATSSSTVSFQDLPAFLSHVQPHHIEHALQVAQRRHEAEIARALSNYNTDDVIDCQPDLKVLDRVQCRRIGIQAPATIPDFVDELEPGIFVTDPPLFTRDECNEVIQKVEDYVAHHSWGQHDSGQYKISGVWVKDAPQVQEWFLRMARQRLFPLLQRLYPDFVDDPADLCIDSAYLFKYTPETGRRTEVHTDCGCLTFTIALNSEYEGGGTWFEGLEQEDPVLHMEAGQVTLRPGGVRHAGCAIEAGARYIIGGFCMNRKRVERVRLLMSQDATTNDEEQQANVEAAVALNPRCDTGYNHLASFCEKRGEIAKAKVILEYGLANVHPTSGDFGYALGSIYNNENNFEKVRACMDICLQMDPFDIDAMNLKAEACVKLGDAAGERECYERIIAAPGGVPKRVAAAHVNLGILQQGTDDEINCYQKALEIRPELYSAHYSLASAYASRRQWELAIPSFREAAARAENIEEEAQALKTLYKAAQNLVRDNQEPLGSREEIIRRFEEIVGKENYAKLAAMR